MLRVKKCVDRNRQFSVRVGVSGAINPRYRVVINLYGGVSAAVIPNEEAYADTKVGTGLFAEEIEPSTCCI